MRREITSGELFRLIVQTAVFLFMTKLTVLEGCFYNSARIFTLQERL